VTRTEPTFSVIIPTYQRPALLARCLEALALSSTVREDYEVIVVDDSSPLPLEEIVAPFGERMTVRLLRQANAGPAAARNTGAAEARGEFLAFTDDDCIPTAGWLDALARPLHAAPHRMVGGRVRNALRANPYSSASQAIIDMVYAYYNANPSQARFFASSNMALPADTFRGLGGFTASFRTSEDRDLCDRWLGAGYPLISAPDAVVDHAHELTLRAFWRQHVGYGRGAFRFYRAHAQRLATDSTLQPGFYVAMSRRLPQMLRGLPVSSAVVLAGLLGLWQVANLVGFASEAAGAGFGAPVVRRNMRHASR
jgi:GT2 family glycosyltransferase